MDRGPIPEPPKVLPVAGKTEFPFPTQGSRAASSNSITQSQTEPLSKSSTLKTSRSGTAFPASRPKVPGPHLSERPIATGQGSYFGLKRAKTAFTPTALTEAVEEASTDSDSSGGGGDDFISPSKQLSGLRATNSAQNPSASHPRQESRNDQFSRFAIGNENYKTKGRMSRKDGRLNISVNETANRGYLAKTLSTSLKQHVERRHTDNASTLLEEEEDAVDQQISHPRRPDFHKRVTTACQQPLVTDSQKSPRLNIVVMVIGSRGDIQPFLKIGKLLKEKHGHRVRIATHPAFREFVERDTGLEFFSVGGDPAELMAFMVKNPGLLPSASTVRAGEVGRRRDSMFEMFQGFWRACINATDDEHDAKNVRMMDRTQPFIADAIIANPPSFAHVHCAERLGIPLHLMFTFPYSPTQQFPHPLANIKKSNVDPNYTNFMSYPLVEMMTWQGLGDLVNRFRVRTLGLEPVSTLWAPGQLYRQRVPYTYLWSPGLIPKPFDWGPEIDIAGFVFLELASSFKPPDPLVDFLAAGESPIYIGFGSIVVDDPDAFTKMIFEAVKKAGVRALVSKGWGGLGEEGNVPDNIFMLENTPHDWLFPRVSAVVHHGGAGTTAIGLKCGKPTMIVPFFGDQPFWGAMVSKAGAGPQEAIPYKHLSIDALADGIRQCLMPTALEAAKGIASAIEEEGDGAENAVEAFQRHLPLNGDQSLRCSIFPERVAIWSLRNSNLRLSALAATLLVQQKKVTRSELKIICHYDWNDFEGPGEPITGTGAALLTSVGSAAKGVGGVPVRWVKTIQRKEKKRKRRKSSTIPRSSCESEIQDSQTGKASSHDVGGHEDMEQKPADAEVLPNGHTSPTDKDIPLTSPSEATGPRPDLVAHPTSPNLARALADDTTSGIARTGEAIARAPMDLSLALAQGFHNAPRLYGDSTVRTAPRVTGVKSGFRAAGREFGLGVWDGVTGLVKLPVQGWKEGAEGSKKDHVKGGMKGVGKGVGGFVLKDLGALFAGGWAIKGVFKEGEKRWGKNGREGVDARVRRGREKQGQLDVERLINGNQGGDGQLSDGTPSLHQAKKRVLDAWEVVEALKKEEQAAEESAAEDRRKASVKEKVMLAGAGSKKNAGERKANGELKPLG